jgi:hypothetical protein
MEKHKNLLGKLEVMHSTVRGVHGLLPTEEKVHRLEKLCLMQKPFGSSAVLTSKAIQNTTQFFMAIWCINFGSAADWPKT